MGKLIQKLKIVAKGNCVCFSCEPNQIFLLRFCFSFEIFVWPKRVRIILCRRILGRLNNVSFFFFWFCAEDVGRGGGGKQCFKTSENVHGFCKT